VHWEEKYLVSYTYMGCVLYNTACHYPLDNPCVGSPSAREHKFLPSKLSTALLISVVHTVIFVSAIQNDVKNHRTHEKQSDPCNSWSWNHLWRALYSLNATV
jgi:hypothetical protein